MHKKIISLALALLAFAPLAALAETLPGDDGAAGVVTFDQDLYYGMRNNADVSNLQEFLTDQGLYSGTITGNFFILTRNAVKKFQTQNGLRPTGYFGPLSRGIANRILAGESVSPAPALTHTPSSSASARFHKNDRIRTTDAVKVRSSGTTDAAVLDTQPSGASGTLLLDPVSANGYVWWYVDYDTGIDGWSAEDFLMSSQISVSLSASLTPSSATCTIGGGESSCPITISWTSNITNGVPVLDRVDADGFSNPTSFASGASGSQTVQFGSGPGYYFRIFSDSSKSILLATTPLLKGVSGSVTAQNTISATPNPCTIPSGSPSCSVTVTWNSTYADAVVDRVDADGTSHPTIFAIGSSGTQAVEFGATPYYFRLFSDYYSANPKLIAVTPLVKGTAEVAGTLAATLTVSPASVSPGQIVTATWNVTSGTPNQHDWIGFYLSSDPNSMYKTFKSTGGNRTGTFEVTAPLTAGTYEFRYLVNNGYTDIARSARVSVVAAATPPFPSPPPPPPVPGPTVIRLTPNSGPVGTRVAMEGTGFLTIAPGNDVWFGLTKIPGVLATDSTHLSFTTVETPTIGANTTIGVSVVNKNGVSTSTPFTVTASLPAAPAITALTPDTGPSGTQVTVSGSGFTATANTVKFGSSSITGIPSSSGTALVFTVPALTTTGSQKVTVSNVNGTSNEKTFTLTQTQTSAPVIISLSPIAGPIGTIVTITGTGFTPTSNSISFRSRTLGADLLAGQTFTSSASGTKLTFTVPAAYFLDVYDVAVKNANGTSASAAYTLTTTSSSSTTVPTITSISPVLGPVGTVVTITGTGFLSTGNTVIFGPTNQEIAATYTDSAHIQFTIPANASYFDIVKVKNANGESSSFVVFTLTW